MSKLTHVLGSLLLLLGLWAWAAFGQASQGRHTVTIEGVAVAQGQPLVFAKRVAWMDAMRTLAEQALGVEFVLDAQKPGTIRYTVRGDVAPSGTAQQVSAESLPTGVYRIALKVEVDSPPPSTDSLPEVTAEGKGDVQASRSLVAARTAAKATALAEAVKKVALDQATKSGRPVPRMLCGHAYYVGPVSERVEGNFYLMTAKFKIVLKP